VNLLFDIQKFVIEGYMIGEKIKHIAGVLLFIAAMITGPPACNTSPPPPSDETATAAKAAMPQIADSLNFPEPVVDIDWDEIVKRGYLVALTGYSASSYFIYKGQPMGFEYELLHELTNYLNIGLEIVVVKDLDHIFDLLNRGDGDIVAYNMTITKSRLKNVAFTDHHTLIRQVLVQRMPDNWRSMKRHEIDKVLITNPVDLIGKKVHVRKGSSYYHRLVNLSDEIGGDIDIVEVPGDISTETLIAMVSRGEIDYTVADENVAQINAGYFDNIDIRVAISLPQRLAWAVRKNSPKLLEKINEWLRTMRREPIYNILYAKYHQNKRFYTQRIRSEYSSLSGDKISEYDDIIREEAKAIGWDWRLLAALIYQESEFDPHAKSWAGAQGLMQLMPATAREFGAHNRRNPKENIAAGVRYLKWLWDYWKDIPDSTERIKFVLGSFNVGQGHVEDARKLTEKYGSDPNIWDGHVANYLLLKSEERFFNDPVVQFGYCRGEEPVNYVESIFSLYRDYSRLIQ
jgi:membrane-bound lytic murein transglycosylase F